MAVVWNYENAAHLLRRAAFGGTPSQIQEFFARHPSVESAVDELLSFRPVKIRPPAAANAIDILTRWKMQRWWIERMVNAPKPADACREKLALFWHDHLASGASKQPTLQYMCIQNGLFRLHARGNLRALVREFSHDPANLYYLDGILNVSTTDGIHVNANENFARELMELFTLGVFQFTADGSPDPTRPNYTESDVHNVARACTGWLSVKGSTGVWYEWGWDGGRYDDNGDGLPDPVKIFGVTNNNFRIDDAVADTPNDVLQLIFSRTDYEGKNQAGIFLSRKLWTWYVYPPPAPGLKALFNAFSDLLVANNFEVTPLLRTLWTHDEFYSPQAKTRAVKNPVDYIVQSLCAFGVRLPGKFVSSTDGKIEWQLQRMGMDLFEPPDVAGWPAGLDWIDTGTLLARLDFAKDLAATGTHTVVIALATIPGLIGNPAADPGTVVDTILTQLGLNATTVGGIPRSRLTPLTNRQRDILLAYLTDNGQRPTLDLANERTNDAVIKVKGLIALALQTAEHQVF